ncbi:MAG: pyridoxine 5-phosphate synthase [Parcubacteria group bacterium Gr01-1014_33]|nr:MAG: pyridoxine 5-phosphate synthase [Parcubacteria group bacterium Gr01-1014_33]
MSMNVVLRKRQTPVMLNGNNKVVKQFPLILRKRLPREVSIVEISEKESQRINRLYRKKNKPTNVLSFRYGSDYGEILLCPEVIRREARESGNPQEYQMTWMIVHGMIHLAGLHHERSEVLAKQTAKLEVAILRKIFISQPNESRSLNHESRRRRK